jgi:DNA-binding transcriptional LysR family regulator
MLSRQFGNQVLPFPTVVAAMDAYLYWHASTDNDAANRWLREAMLRSLKR